MTTIFSHQIFDKEYLNKTYSELINYCIPKLQSTETTKYVYEHSYKVMQVSLYIHYLITPTIDIKKEELIIGGLLHDITKARSLKTKEHHAETGIAAKELGCDQIICDIISQHVDPIKEKGKLTSIDIVCYADKRVKWDYVVTLDERMKDIYIRYHRDANEETVKKQKLRDDLYLMIENEIGILAEKNGKKDEFIQFISASQEGIVERFKGIEQGELL